MIFEKQIKHGDFEVQQIRTLTSLNILQNIDI